jgi:ferrous iron transport protein B
MAAEFTIALAGNPNSGKSTIFNSLTGGRQHVGNWPGKTVEKKEGIWRHDGRDIKVVDLPGTYSLTAYSLEEVIARDYIVDERPQVVVDVVDAANLERNLYLAVQVLELGADLVIALNMSDMAQANGYKIDIAKLSEGLGGIPVVPTVASRGQGMEDLKEKIVQVARSQPGRRAAAAGETG